MKYFFATDTEEQTEALVDTLQIDGTTLSDANLSGLSSTDLEQLADLEAELCMNTADIEGTHDVIYQPTHNRSCFRFRGKADARK